MLFFVFFFANKILIFFTDRRRRDYREDSFRHRFLRLDRALLYIKYYYNFRASHARDQRSIYKI